MSLLTDCWFMAWVYNIEKQWRQSQCDMGCISPDHDVGQCIRGYKLLANIPWDSVDEVIIPVNINDKFHWFLIVFRIKSRCLYVYDSMMGGSVYSRKVKEVVDKLATMIPLFLTSTGFYGKRLDLYANNCHDPNRAATGTHTYPPVWANQPNLNLNISMYYQHKVMQKT